MALTITFDGVLASNARRWGDGYRCDAPEYANGEVAVVISDDGIIIETTWLYDADETLFSRASFDVDAVSGIAVLGLMDAPTSSVQTSADFKQATKFTLAADDTIDAIVVEYEP